MGPDNSGRQGLLVQLTLPDRKGTVAPCTHSQQTLLRASSCPHPQQVPPRHTRGQEAQRNPQTQPLRGGQLGALHPEGWGGARSEKLGLLLSEGRTFRRVI